VFFKRFLFGLMATVAAGRAGLHYAPHFAGPLRQSAKTKSDQLLATRPWPGYAIPAGPGGSFSRRQEQP
jgi:hypothetical protein